MKCEGSNAFIELSVIVIRDYHCCIQNHWSHILTSMIWKFVDFDTVKPHYY